MRTQRSRFFAKMPAIEEKFSRPQGFKYEPDQPLAAAFRARSGVESGDRPTISMFDFIGDEGFSDARMAAALRTIGADTDVTVEINSPGGDYFQGVAIFNMLARHRGKVTVHIMGIAASAASLVAMAADRVLIPSNGEIMIHKAWGITVGNSDDHSSTIETLKHLDQAMAETYAKRAGREPAEMLRMMAKNSGDGTYLRGQAAVDIGLADALLDIHAQAPVYAETSVDLPESLRGWDKKLAEGGKLTKAERRSLFNDIRGTQDAVAPAMQDAGVLASLQALASTISIND
ncbi:MULTISPECIES: head maturation protease, ClpP-related [unclassified Rhizobium]|uniref:head maturation protease, ClpP-related n=1 Tax=unclassified Rhizobium TaxID=2613769 RepID=UPI001AEA6599|nr:MULTISPECIES: head maturation protease, ClpP-related [unclassified Rhizobium]MBP2459595.1 ATP-dependent protease ClpP protease subunit [Rhizobium sp. PvP014]MBP2531889.1 ATP-dependent protease ClpP protease subunit [Rhizobium sp. PvP099]